MINSFDELPPAFQRYAHDEYLGGEGSKLRGISREERDTLFGQNPLKRVLKCKNKIKEILEKSNVVTGGNQ